MTPGASSGWEFEAIGTRWHVQTAAPVPEAVRAEVRALI